MTYAFYAKYTETQKNPDPGIGVFSKNLMEIVELSVNFLKDAEKISLTSMVQGKRYFLSSKNGKASRAVNSDLFLEGHEHLDRLSEILKNPFSHKETAEQITKILYTASTYFICANNIRNERDNKTPGTFFEYFNKAVLSSHFGFMPVTKLPVMNMDEDISLPVDYVFDLGRKLPKFHVPIKTSTRERIIQVWAHQRVVDGAYGVGRFLGFPIIHGETKLSKQSREVVEICLPNQWRLYQLFIAQMWGVAYYDLPGKYDELNSTFPIMKICPIGEYLKPGGIIESYLNALPG